jgi:hypothetical protein
MLLLGRAKLVRYIKIFHFIYSQKEKKTKKKKRRIRNNKKG